MLTSYLSLGYRCIYYFNAGGDGPALPQPYVHDTLCSKSQLLEAVRKVTVPHPRHVIGVLVRTINCHLTQYAFLYILILAQHRKGWACPLYGCWPHNIKYCMGFAHFAWPILNCYSISYSEAKPSVLQN